MTYKLDESLERGESLGMTVLVLAGAGVSTAGALAECSRNMNGSSEKETLELEVADFGPIIEATVDLRPMTVFVGPSNTGKSYLAILIYALHRFFSGPSSGLIRGSLLGGYPILRGMETEDLPKETVDALMQTARKLLNRRGASARQSVELSPPVADLVRSSFDKSRAALVGEICRCFGIDDTRTLTRRGRNKGARIGLRRMSVGSALFEHQLMLSGAATDLRTTIPEQIPVRVSTKSADELRGLLHRVDLEEPEGEGPHYGAWWVMDILSNYVLPYLASPLHLPAYYLPADRTGVMHAHSVVVSALIGSAPTAGLRPAARTPVLSGVLADFLEQLIEVDRFPLRRRKREHDLGVRIEESILGGSVRVDRSTAINYPHFVYRPDGWKDDLPLMNASSMVSELAPVVLYLRHLVDPGNVLIVEEPESHLHPAMQVKFTRQLAMLVRSGVNVIVTTHSEWLLEELANIVRRSELPEASRTNSDVALRPDQVGAWLFQQKSRPKGSVVAEIGLDEAGLYPSGFADVAATLHNDWAELSSRIGAGS